MTSPALDRSIAPVRVVPRAIVRGAASAAPVDLWGEGCVLDAHEAFGRLGADPNGRFDPDSHASRTGVVHRQWCPEGAAGSLELGAAAARGALGDAGWSAGELDALVVATCTPPRITRALAAQVAVAIGASCQALDVRAGGAGGLEAWALGHRLAAGPSPARVLVVAAEAASAYANDEDPANALLFGDGGAAIALEGRGDAEAADSLFVRSAVRVSDGQAFSVGGQLPPTEAAVASRAYRFGRPDEAYRRSLTAAWDDALEGLGLDIARYVPDRTRLTILPYAVAAAQLDRVERALGLPVDHARAQLAERGCLGVAGPLDLFARVRPAAMATAAVGGGIQLCSLVLPGARP